MGGPNNEYLELAIRTAKIEALKELREKVITIPQWIIGGENQSDDYREGYKKAWDDSRQRSSEFINEQIRELEEK